MTPKLMPDTPHQREQDQITVAIGDQDKAIILHILGHGGHGRAPERRHVALAALFSARELEELLLGAEQLPVTKWKNVIEIGHHQRDECLERKGEWCRGIGNHEPRCDSCPTRNGDRVYMKSLLDRALELRLRWDKEMWR